MKTGYIIAAVALAAVAPAIAQQIVQPERSITLNLTETDVKVVMSGLGELKGSVAFYTTKKVIEQYEAQTKPPEPPK